MDYLYARYEKKFKTDGRIRKGKTVCRKGKTVRRKNEVFGYHLTFQQSDGPGYHI